MVTPPVYIDARILQCKGEDAFAVLGMHRTRSKHPVLASAEASLGSRHCHGPRTGTCGRTFPRAGARRERYPTRRTWEIKGWIFQVTLDEARQFLVALRQKLPSLCEPSSNLQGWPLPYPRTST